MYGLSTTPLYALAVIDLDCGFFAHEPVVQTRVYRLPSGSQWYRLSGKKVDRNYIQDVIQSRPNIDQSRNLSSLDGNICPFLVAVPQDTLCLALSLAEGTELAQGTSFEQDGQQ
jgi:hypothetical protein